MINQEIICQLKYGIASSVSKKVCTCICVQYFMSLSVFQFVVEDSVEERMMALQDQKRKLMQGAFGQKQTADDKRTNRIRDIKTLMDLWDVARRIGEERLIPGPYCRMIDREECGITLNCELNFVLLITTSMSKLYSNALIHLLSLPVHRPFYKVTWRYDNIFFCFNPVNCLLQLFINFEDKFKENKSSLKISIFERMKNFFLILSKVIDFPLPVPFL